MNILYLTIYKKWFDEILSGRKKVEFRDRTPYWNNRLAGRYYDEIHFRNGYTLDRPFMRVECVLIDVFDEKRWGIILGNILEVRNYNCIDTLSLDGASLAGRI